MNIRKLFKRGLVALFFTSFIASASSNLDMTDLQPMETQTSMVFTADPLKGIGVEGYDFSAYCKKKWSTKPQEYRSHAMDDYYKTPSLNGYVSVTCSAVKWRMATNGEWIETSSKWIKTYNHPYETTETPVCPPQGFPTYQTPVDSDDDGEYDSCAKRLECPTGFFRFKVRGECIPINCPSEGVQDTIWANGSVYTGQSGTYCDGSCAFSAAGGQNEGGYRGNIFLTVVSTGAQCGQEFGELNGANHEFYEGDLENTCSTGVTSNGQPSVDCSSGDDPDNPDEPDTPDEPENPIDLTDEQDTDIGEITPVSEDCDVTDTACEMRNIQEKLDSENLELKTEQQEQHNKLIKAQEKSTNELVDAINGFRESNNVGQQGIKKAIENGGTGTGSGGGGGGVGGGTDEGEEGTEKTRNTEPSEGLEGFYESEYESEYENGFEGMFNEKMAEYKETEFFTFLEQFKPSFGGSAPNMSFCMNFGSYMNLGCFSLDLDPRILPALKIFILITAGFTCRKIIFGG